MTEQDHRFEEGRKRGREEQAVRSKRLRTEPKLTPRDLSQIELLVFNVVQQYDETIAENASEFGLGFGEVPPSEFEFYLSEEQSDFDGFPAEDADSIVPEYVAESPRTSEWNEASDDSYPETSVTKGEVPPGDEDVVMGSYPEEVAPSPQQEIVVEEEAEEFDEYYVDQAAGEMVGEALGELLDEVISELSTDDSPDPQVLRLLIQGDAEIAGLLATARAEMVSELKEAILGLSRETVMVER